jgi:hypothetical protein
VVKNEPQDASPLTYPPTLHPTPFPPRSPQKVMQPQASTSAVSVKPEPTLDPFFLLSAIPEAQQIPLSPVKAEAKPDIKPDIKHEADQPLLPRETHHIYKSVGEIDYTPENALAEGVQMAKTIGLYLKQIDLGSQLRKDVWLREVEKYAFISLWMRNATDLSAVLLSLKSQGVPHTMIAVCGATGAGKSSLLNAVLQGLSRVFSPRDDRTEVCVLLADNIVPTSGMRGEFKRLSLVRH